MRACNGASMPQEHRLSTAFSALRAAAPTARVLILLIRCGLTSPPLPALVYGVLFLLCRRAATTLLLISTLALFRRTLLLAAALLVVLVHQFSLAGPEAHVECRPIGRRREPVRGRKSNVEKTVMAVVAAIKLPED